MAMNSARLAVPISDVTDRVGDALSELCQSAERLQGLIAPLILKAAACNPSHLQELQDFDQICQKLGDIADFIAALALVLPEDWRLDPSVASRMITMSDLSSKLGFAEDADAARDHASGDFERF
jgi:hypothetical protein